MKEKITTRELAEIAGISTNTLNTHIKLLRDMLTTKNK